MIFECKTIMVEATGEVVLKDGQGNTVIISLQTARDIGRYAGKSIKIGQEYEIRPEKEPMPSMRMIIATR